MRCSEQKKRIMGYIRRFKDTGGVKSHMLTFYSTFNEVKRIFAIHICGLSIETCIPPDTNKSSYPHFMLHAFEVGTSLIQLNCNNILRICTQLILWMLFQPLQKLHITKLPVFFHKCLICSNYSIHICPCQMESTFLFTLCHRGFYYLIFYFTEKMQ